MADSGTCYEPPVDTALAPKCYGGSAPCDSYLYGRDIRKGTRLIAFNDVLSIRHVTSRHVTSPLLLSIWQTNGLNLSRIPCGLNGFLQYV